MCPIFSNSISNADHSFRKKIVEFHSPVADHSLLIAVDLSFLSFATEQRLRGDANDLLVVRVIIKMRTGERNKRSINQVEAPMSLYHSGRRKPLISRRPAPQAMAKRRPSDSSEINCSRKKTHWSLCPRYLNNEASILNAPEEAIYGHTSHSKLY
ncbi:hypothetical protein AVEN_34683-1 [Araneus ventricosus]|uniref:Uncharacterized protein n=1 Tax=Araneus ventricosus TaxID=182803 RepID=A0A4Y2B2G1_ARAVE|nr:hypothetical protein AVEN_34683-1 [Araneus ventricosus]